MFPGISMSEIFVVMLVVLLLFGAKGIPKVAKRMGQYMRIVQKALDDVKKEFRDFDIKI